VKGIVSTEHRRSLALVVAGTVKWSSTGVFLRILHLDIWTVLVWRSLFGAGMLFAQPFLAAAITLVWLGERTARAHCSPLPWRSSQYEMAINKD
jgi:hypothetical protein